MSLRSARLSSLGAFALAFATLLSTTLAGQQAKVLAPHKPIPPRLPDSLPTDRPLRSMVGGLWITDANFKSSIYISSNLAVAPLVVTPLLYLSNGRKVILPDVKLEASGTAVVSINDALRDQGIAPWATLIGYVEIDYRWPWDAICVTVDSVDVVHSTIFDFAVQSSASRHPQGQADDENMARGMWWKEELNVAGFVALSNTSEAEISAAVQTSNDLGAPLGQRTIALGPHRTKRIYLPELLSASAGSSGGLEVAYKGTENALTVNGGLEDPAVGYSANIPFVPSPAAQAASPRSYTALGLMAGAADPMMLFPADTVFRPYSVLRNISASPMSIRPVLWWMEGGPRSAQLPQFNLPPGQTRTLPLLSQLTEALGGSLNGSLSFNVVLETQGDPHGLLMASGSVDQKNNYVFGVRTHMVEETASRSVAYWSTANGDDTMVTLWNPADEAQDFIFTLFFLGGHYRYPVHLGPRATHMFNLSEIVHNQIADDEGNVIPATVHEGSARISGSRAENEHILAAIDAAIYNVRKATCHITCVTCDGSVALSATDNPFSVSKGGTHQLSFTSSWNTGKRYNLTTSSRWTSNHTTLATVGTGTGLVAGVASGAVTMTATTTTEPIFLHECDIGANCLADQVDGGSGSTNGAVTPGITGVSPPQLVIGSNGTMSISGFGFSAFPGTPTVQFNGTGIATSGASVINDGDIFADYSVSSSAAVGTQDLTVSFPGTDGGAAAQSNPWPVSIVQAVSISGISPVQGLVGTAINVTISGSGFVSGATVNAGANISVTNVRVTSSTQITATFTPTDSSSAGGNQTVTVTAGGLTSPSATFYVQIPSKMSMSNYESLVLITNGSVLDYFGNVLATNECGGYRNIAYNLLDQKQGTISGGNFTLTENFSNYSLTFGGKVPPTQSSTQNTGVQTLADTQFIGNKAPSCPGSNDHESFSQSFSITVGSTTYPISTVNQIARGEYTGTFHVDVTVVTP